MASTPTKSFLYIDSSKFKEINIQKQNCRGTRKIFLFCACLISAFIFIEVYSLPVWARPHPETGVQKEYYDNGKLQSEVKFKEGKVIKKRFFYNNGRLQYEAKYKNGILLARRTFYENGNLQSLWTPKLKVTKYYNEDGSLRAVVDTSTAPEAGAAQYR